MLKKSFLIVALIVTSLAGFSQNFVTVKGDQIIGPDGRPVLLKGINTGNWLVPEGYMFTFKKTNSGRLINDLFCEMVGPSDAAGFWSRFLDNYITKEDIKYIKGIKTEQMLSKS